MPIFTLPGGEVRDETRQPLYDTVVVAAGEGLVGTRRFFQSITDAAGLPKSLAATNMEQNSQLPTATSFRVQGISVDSDNITELNEPFLPTWLRNSSIALNIGVKNYWKSPLRFACGRMQNMYATGSDISLIHQQFGWAAVQPVTLRGFHVIDIDPLQNFLIVWETLAQDLTAAELAFTVAAGSNLKMVASLKGILRRPVQ